MLLEHWTSNGSNNNTGVVSSNPEHVTIKLPLVRKAMGNHLVKSTFLEKLRVLSMVSAKLEIEYVTQVTVLIPKENKFEAGTETLSLARN